MQNLQTALFRVETPENSLIIMDNKNAVENHAWYQCGRRGKCIPP